MGDVLSLGLTKKYRQQTGLNDYACKNSSLYSAGLASGSVLGLAICSHYAAVGCEALNAKMLSIAAGRATAAAYAKANKLFWNPNWTREMNAVNQKAIEYQKAGQITTGEANALIMG
ncbi:MAG: hypothetical protein ACYC0V_12550 [Armatimonadota bacterium]